VVFTLCAGAGRAAASVASLTVQSRYLSLGRAFGRSDPKPGAICVAAPLWIQSRPRGDRFLRPL